MDIRLTKARISYASGLWNASAAVEGGLKKHNCDFLIGEDTKVERRTADGKWVATTIKEAQELTAVEAFKGDKKKAVSWLDDLDARQKSVRSGNKNKDKNGEVRPGYEDCDYVHATSKTRMPVYRANRTVVNSEDESPVYSGCYVVARVSLYCNLKPGQKGLFCSLQGTQFHSDGDSFGGGRAADSGDFEEIAEGAEAEDFS